MLFRLSFDAIVEIAKVIFVPYVAEAAVAT